jgi:hypothetical protein
MWISFQDLFDLAKHDKTSGESKEQKETYVSGDYRFISPTSLLLPPLQELL